MSRGICRSGADDDPRPAIKRINESRPKAIPKAVGRYHEAMNVNLAISLDVRKRRSHSAVCTADAQPHERERNQLIERLVQWRYPIEPDQIGLHSICRALYFQHLGCCRGVGEVKRFDARFRHARIIASAFDRWARYRLPMKRLMILRHGKSDWYAGAESDHGRPLNKRGTAAARTMGRILTRIGEIPDIVYTSSAVRATETTLLAAEAGGWESERIEADGLYGATAAKALAVAASAPDNIEKLLLVGHEPTWSYLVHSLTGASIQMKTATVAAIDLSISTWREAPHASGSLAYLLQPRLFADWDV